MEFILLFLKKLNSIQFFLIIISIVILFTLLYVENKYKKTFQKSLIFSILCSILAINTIFIIYSLFPDNNIMEKLVQGEILAGIAIAFPTIVLWSYETRERRLERLKDNYNKWIETFKISKNNDRIGLLNQLINFLEKSKLIDNDQEIIDYKHLFILLQIIMNSEFDDENVIVKQWRTINLILLENINEKSASDLKSFFENQLFYLKNFSLNAIDFIELERKSIQLKDFQGQPIDITFNNCVFNYDDLISWSFFASDNEYIFNNCTFDRQIENDDLINLENKDYKFKFNGYYLLGEEISQKYFVVEDSRENKGNSSTPDKYKKADEIFEERELKSMGPINEYLCEGRSLEIEIDISNQGSLNEKIIKKVISNIESEIELDNIFISRSKSYLQNETDIKKYNWRSWNVISEENANNENYSLFIFAIQLDKDNDTKFECVIMEKEKFRKLLEYKTLTKDKRYYFYFSNPKVNMKLD